ncbi:hypothetical protein P5V15_013747 [Pogonomyrmex californicus]
MFATIFICTLVTTLVTAEIPSYIHVCSRKDPNLDQCITDSINNLRSKLCEGISEMEVPSLNSFIINEIVISDADNAKLYLKDLKIDGLCDYVIDSFHIDLDKLHFDAHVSFKQIKINATYDFDIHLLVPFVQKGPVYLTSDNIEGKIGVDLKVITKNDKKYIYISKINLNLDIKTLSNKFDTEGQNSSQLNEIISNFVGSNEEEFIKKVKPSLEEQVTKQIIFLANNIVKHFTYDELFPEQV